MKNFILAIFLLCYLLTFSQSHRFQLVGSDQTYVDQNQTNVTIAEGNVHVTHLGQGVSLKCDKAFFYKSSNTLKAEGNVFVNQGDTLYQKSDFATYQGKENRITSWGEVLVKNRLMELKTDSLVFDRKLQQLYFQQQGTIQDEENTLQSKEGRYHLTTKLFEAIDSVFVSNIDGSTLTSNKLEYYTHTGIANIVAPTTISNNVSLVSTKRGFYNTKKNKAKFTDSTFISIDDIEIRGDTFYYEKKIGLYSAQSDFEMIDIKNKLVLRGGYAELYLDKDSILVSDRAILIQELSPKDSLYISSDLLEMFGKKYEKLISASGNVKFFNKDLQGVCGLIESDQKTNITKLKNNPIVWAKNTQITGDSIWVSQQERSRKLDSIQVFGNKKKRAFLARKDTLSAGYNQLSGAKIYGSFFAGKLSSASVLGAPKSIIYLRDERNELIGIDQKQAKKSIEVSFKDDKIAAVSYLQSVTGSTIQPSSKEAENIENLKGFSWQGDLRPMSAQEIVNQQNNTISRSEKKE